jgi:ferredoxin
MKGRYILNMPPTSSNKPITWHLIRDYNFKVNIWRAQFNAGKEGHLLIEVDAAERDLQRGLKFLQQEGIHVVPLNRKIKIDKRDCIHCGVCTAVCFMDALVMDQKTKKLVFLPDKCLACELCVKACPLRIISIDF